MNGVSRYVVLPVAIATVALIVLSTTSIAWAQDAVPVAKAPAAAPPAFPTLKAALEVTAWDDAERGPLMAIAPERVKDPETPAADGSAPVATNAAEDDASRQPLLPPRKGFGLNASVVARHFGRRLVSVGSLTVMAPLEMVLLNRDLKPANPFLDLSTEDKMRRLEATLSAAQWAQLGSAEGLGSSDLNPEQVLLFAALVPETVRFVRAKVPAFDADESAFTKPPSSTLSPTERASVRLRLDRVAELSLLEKDKSPLLDDNAFFSYAAGQEALFYDDQNPLPLLRDDRLIYGQSLLTTRANALKRSDLELHTPDMEATISVAGVRTVGDLVRVIRTTLGREIYADRRLASFPLYFSPQAHGARAGDLLEALCWGLTGTFRKVGPPPMGSDKESAYILTYDREGVAVRRSLIREWQTLGEEAKRDAESALQGYDPAPRIAEVARFATGDLLALTPEAEKQLEDADKPDLTLPTLPITALTPAQRRQVQDSLTMFMEEHAEDEKKPDFPRTDRVGVRLSLGLTLVVPGVGEIRQIDSWPDPKFQQNIVERYQKSVIEDVRKQYQSDPVAVQNATVCLAPHTRAEVETAMDALKPRGITTFWIRVPETPEGRALLADCVVAGKARGIPVGAVVSLMAPPTASIGKLPEALEDLNLLGETGTVAAGRIAGMTLAPRGTDPFHESRAPDPTDWIAPEAPGALPLLRDRLHAVAAVPGLAALVCDQSASPGHRTRRSRDRLFWFGTEFGYTVVNRLAMIRELGFDPIDVGEPGGMELFRGGNVHAETLLPFLDDEAPTVDAPDPLAKVTQTTNIVKEADKANPQDFWVSFRAGLQRQLLASLRTDLLANYPNLPIFFSVDALHGAYERWDHPTDPLWIESSPGQALPALLQALTPPTPLDNMTLSRLYRSVVYRDDMLGYLKNSFYGKAIDVVTPMQLLASAIKGTPLVGRAPSVLASCPPVIDLSSLSVDIALPLLKAALVVRSGSVP